MHTLTKRSHKDSNLVGDLPGFFPVWFNKYFMINILSFVDILNVYCITIDSEVAVAINVHTKNNNIILLKEVASGLYVLNVIHNNVLSLSLH